MRTASKLKKLNDKDQTQLQQNSTQNTLGNLKSVKMTAEETNFIIEYRRLEDLEREKGIKFFQCVGDEPHTIDFVGNINQSRTSLVSKRECTMRDQD